MLQQRNANPWAPQPKNAAYAEKTLWTYPQAADRLQVSERKLQAMVAKREVPHLRIDGSVRFCPEALDRWITERLIVPVEGKE